MQVFGVDIEKQNTFKQKSYQRLKEWRVTENGKQMRKITHYPGGRQDSPQLSALGIPRTVILLNLHINQRILIIPNPLAGGASETIAEMGGKSCKGVSEAE